MGTASRSPKRIISHDNFREEPEIQSAECSAFHRFQDHRGQSGHPLQRPHLRSAHPRHDYSRLWDQLEADWQPQDRTERCYLETMVTSQWLLARVADSERKVYEFIEFGEKQFVMLGYVSKQRAQLERSFRTAIEDMKQSQKERQARQPQQRECLPADNSINTGPSERILNKSADRMSVV